MTSLLEVKDLKTYFNIGYDTAKAVDGVSFSLEKNETLAIVGESGSGKSATVLSIMRLIKDPGEVAGGDILFNNESLLMLSERKMSRLRGNRISMIYQEPMTSLNPAISVGEQIREAMIIHKTCSRKESRKRALELMKDVRIPDAEIRYKDIPGKFSGGMRQRIIIAMAIACNPDILIADEPTTALDVTIQAEIMELLRDLKKKMKMSMLLITHDFGLVAENADRVLVMYCGKIMEEASVDLLFRKPKHPYTLALMECIPSLDIKADKLSSIPGYVPHPTQYPTGCRFSSRCPSKMDICKEKLPELIEIEDGHKVGCWLYI